MKYTGTILLLLLLISCGVNNRKKAEERIATFEEKLLPDKRESVFNVEPAFHRGKVVLRGETDNPALKMQLLDSLETIKVVDEITVLPDSSVGDTPFGLVNLSAASFRAEPAHSSELVTQALLGTPVKFLKKQDGWLLVQTPDRYIAWADADGLVPLTDEKMQGWRLSDRVIYLGSFTQVYDGMNLEQPLADVTMGGILRVKEKRWNLLNVVFPDGREGYTREENWISFSDFLNTAHPDSSDIVRLATNLTGRPYLWGGTSSVAMDCSGFTKMVYFMHGIILARDASLQAKHGKTLDSTLLSPRFEPGDLLFFGRKKNEDQPEKITHVALSMGKTAYIHAAGTVQQNSFDPDNRNYSEYRKNTFIKACRIIGSEGTPGIVRVKDHPWY